MRLANLNDRATIVRDEGVIDVEEASEGRFSWSIDLAIARIDALRSWYDKVDPPATRLVDAEELQRDPGLGPVVTSPSQVFAVGLNYRTHALEMGLEVPTRPMLFTKYASSLTGANASFRLVSTRTDWEAELVVVIGVRGRNVAIDDALAHVAGYCVGQDLSERELQMQGPTAQFSLGKSYENFGPIGPWLTTRDEVCNPNDLQISCRVNGVTHQDASTSDMVFTVAQLVSYVSSVCEMRPGDVIFTGSPHGTGQGQRPPVFLAAGDVVETTIESLGSLRNVAHN